MTFPTADSIIVRNEAGEVLGWDRPATAEDFYCDTCGFSHVGECYDSGYEDDPDPDEENDPDPDYENDSGYEDACENISCTCGHPECGAC